MKYQVFTRKTKFGLQVDASIRNINFFIDEPEFNGGSDSGITPVELELGALGADLQKQVELLSKNKAYDFASLSINIEGDIDLAGMHGNPDIPAGFQQIRLSFIFKTSMSQELTNELVQKAIENSMIYKLINKKSNVINQLDYTC